MDISNTTEQLLIVRNDHALKSFLEHRSAAAGFLIEVFSICRINRMHGNAHLIIGVIKQQVNMIVHEAPGQQTNVSGPKSSIQ